MPQPNGLSAGPSKGIRPSSREGASAEGVGEEDLQGAQGFHVGLAPSNLCPPKGIDSGKDIVFGGTFSLLTHFVHTSLPFSCNPCFVMYV